MRITDAFIGEHAVLYPQLAHIDGDAPAYEAVECAHAHAGLLASALASHAALEEELLFVELDRLPEAAGPLAVMREEHLDIETSLARALETRDVGEARDLLLHVIDVARPHFAKEEDVLFPMAERALAEETLLRLGERWAEQRLSGAVRSGAAHA